MNAAAARRHWIAGLLVGILTLGIAAAINLWREIDRPFGGFYTIWNHAQNVWLVEAATPPWWPGLAPGRLQYNDVLVALDGRSYDAQSYHTYVSALQSGRPAVRLAIRRSDLTLELDIPIRQFTLSDFFDIKLPDLINGLGFWLLAMVVYRARPGAPVNRLFAVACSLIAGSIWLAVPTVFPESDSLTRGLLLAWVVVTTFVGPSFIHLTLLFPEPVRRPASRWIRWLYLGVSVVAGLYGLGMLLRWQNGTTDLSNLLSTLGNWAAMGVLLGAGVAVYSGRLLLLLRRRTISRRLRRQVALLLWGLALALPYVLIVIFRVLLQSAQSYYWVGLDVRYLVLAVPLAFAFVILRYQTFRSPHPSLVGVFILASSAMIASVGAWIMRLVEPQWVSSLKWPPFVPIFLGSLISGSFWSTQSSWFGVFSRFFQWERRSYTSVRQFGQQAAGQTDLADLPGTIATALVDNLELERAAVWLWDEKEARFALAGQAGEWPVAPAQLKPEPTLNLKKSVRLATEGDPIPRWLEALSRPAAIEVLTPLWILERPVGLLGLGKRWDEEIFEERDLEIVDLIAQEAALLLLTARQIEQLRQVPHQVATAQERERFKIAQELHDTVQQFLGSLPFYLEVSRSAVRSDPAETEAILARCLGEVESAAQTVRHIRNSLAPLQLEKTLTQPLEMLVEHFRVRTGLACEVMISPTVDVSLSPRARHALYRVVQQALDNVAAHAGASRINLALEQRDGRLLFSIADDGCGFTQRERERAVDRGSFGLTSMQARITSLGGEFAIESAPGAGTRIWGWLPSEA